MRQTLFNVTMATAICCLLVSNGLAQSNWVDFTDERDRMSFDTNDDQEKDMFVGDVDNDGDDDIVVVRKLPFSVAGPRVNMLLINDNGVLVDRTMDFIPTFITDPDNARDVILFDSDNDGDLDMIIGNTFGSLHRLYINQGGVGENWLGYQDQGSNGEWYSPQLPQTPQCCGVATGDVNGDGFEDIYFVDYNNGLEARLFINNQDNTFTDETTTRMSSAARNQAFGTTAFLDDMNGDGHLDIVSNDSVAFGGVGVEIAFNNGSGVFTQTQVLPSVTSYMVQRGDFNNDGRMDIYVVDDGQDYILFNNSTNGNGTINVSMVNNVASSRTQNFNGNILAADVDNDGWLDMAVSDVDVDIPGCGREFTLLRNSGGNFLTDPNNNQTEPWNEQGSHDTVWIDINSDGNLDLFMSTCDTYHMYVNDAEPNVLLGDVNMDGVVNLLDVGPFVDLLSNGGFQAEADINGDGAVNLLDVSLFVSILAG